MKPYAKKRFSQNFLIDPNILRKIVHTINPQRDDFIIEIGSGKGALTRFLLESNAQIHSIEIDSELIPELKKQFSSQSNFFLHHTDALTLDFTSIAPKKHKIRVVGNIPFNITSPLLFKMFENAEIIDDVHFLVQREIARRLCAVPKTKEYGILSVITQFYGSPSIAFDVSPKVFRPIPEVYSSLVSIKIQPVIDNSEFRQNYSTVVRTAFGKRRKTLRNSLSDLLINKSGDCPIDLGRRAESLNVEEFINLTNWLYDIN
ncbi:MAG: 16S rRNA (adenine(1518)-N(6)/adenine(1519)-N(6))-dimethyltransferase RsmA [Candidatus Marinimicrobia bacterium]|nr:16S rRNA (adenine(1518)-N(6)/adenine(1519)-N(6))-dimethyltransferase RsmA [Candidatus Neomarinimicrobiota bacterium]